MQPLTWTTLPCAGCTRIDCGSSLWRSTWVRFDDPRMLNRVNEFNANHQRPTAAVATFPACIVRSDSRQSPVTNEEPSVVHFLYTLIPTVGVFMHTLCPSPHSPPSHTPIVRSLASFPPSLNSLPSLVGFGIRFNSQSQPQRVQTSDRTLLFRARGENLPPLPVPKWSYIPAGLAGNR